MRGAPEILLVEDSPDDVAIALRAFRRGHMEERLAVARNGAEALEYLFDGKERPGPTHLPRVVLLDLRMAGIDGREVLRRLRADERTRGLPVVIVSTSSYREDIESCYRLGANSYVVKQYNLQDPGQYLVEVAKYWLNFNQLPH